MMAIIAVKTYHVFILFIILCRLGLLLLPLKDLKNLLWHISLICQMIGLHISSDIDHVM